MPESELEVVRALRKGHPRLGEICEQAAALIEAQHKALQGMDVHWTEDFPGGPDDPKYATGMIALTDETLSVWREIRAALTLARRVQR
jgi:hypothetical protein